MVHPATWRLIVFIQILINALILRAALTESDRWYYFFLFSLPLLLISRIIFIKK